ncbi:unnamed protein product [Linum trigynum]|uniref:Uncharacterized protein n=1 Tax=Linum trigynum TaxID=586398 RepID=A0AAV2DNB8_9ROSI
MYGVDNCACSSRSRSSINPFNNWQWKRDWGRWLRERRILRAAVEAVVEGTPDFEGDSGYGTHDSSTTGIIESRRRGESPLFC